MRVCPQRKSPDNWSIDDQINFDLINFVDDPNCVICQRSVNKLNKKRGETSRRFSVEQICGKDDPECSDFMFNFMDFFYRPNSNQDALITCSELDVCLMPGRVQILGTNNKCNFGSAYWCLSAGHANACNVSIDTIRSDICYFIIMNLIINFR